MITKAVILLVIVVCAQAAVLNGVAPDSETDRRIGRRNLCHRKAITKVSCVNRTSSLVPHPDDCRLFYLCIQPHAPPICRQCPRGLYFNPGLKVCDWPAHSGCQQKNGTGRVTTARPANSTHHHNHHHNGSTPAPGNSTHQHNHHHNGSTPAPGNSTHHHNHHHGNTTARPGNSTHHHNHHNNGSTPAPSNESEPSSNNTSSSGSSNSTVPDVGGSNSTVEEDSVDGDASTNSSQPVTTNDPTPSTAAPTAAPKPAPAPSKPKRKPRWWEFWH